jgi:hypothetical protein
LLSGVVDCTALLESLASKCSGQGLADLICRCL